MALNPEKPPRDIYVILRVFNIGQDSTGLRIFVDPATMEREEDWSSGLKPSLSVRARIFEAILPGHPSPTSIST